MCLYEVTQAHFRIYLVNCIPHGHIFFHNYLITDSHFSIFFLAGFFFVVFLFIQNTHKKEFFGDAIFLLFLNLLSKIVDKSFFFGSIKK